MKILKHLISLNIIFLTEESCKTGYKAFKLNFVNIKMIPSFLHFFQNIYVKLPLLKDKNKNIKNTAKKI